MLRGNNYCNAIAYQNVSGQSTYYDKNFFVCELLSASVIIITRQKPGWDHHCDGARVCWQLMSFYSTQWPNIFCAHLCLYFITLGLCDTQFFSSCFLLTDCSILYQIWPLISLKHQWGLQMINNRHTACPGLSVSHPNVARHTVLRALP